MKGKENEKRRKEIKGRRERENRQKKEGVK